MVSNFDTTPIFHLLPLPTLVVALDGEDLRIKDINPAYANLLHTQSKELRGKLLEEVFSNSFLPSASNILSSLKKVFASGEKHKFVEAPNQDSEENRNWVWQVEHIPQGNRENLKEVVQVLQKQSRTENWPIIADIPQTSGNPFSLWEEGLKLSKTGTWELDLTSQRLFWSPTVKEIHGVSITYQPELSSAIHFYKEGVSRKVIGKALELAKENGQPFDVELQIITAKGKEKWIRATGKVAFENGLVSRVYGAVQDIDETKRSFMGMLSEKIHYETLLQSIKAIVYVANADKLYLTFVSSQVESLLGYQSWNLTLYQNFWTKFAEKSKIKEIESNYKSLGSQSPSFEMKYVIRHNNGELVPIHDRVTVIKKKNITLFRGVITLD
ncbi:PAS domain-containing protein [Pleomorphovibrio marinus]|uniref:PAS domain-containing protein n=1 Tax=Pleomorphovibrio marinus TaxID=2164132 RepID=UPI000E0B64BD|nr:PAS domain-containing protein [Pleomorphovibrio marinus]